MYAYGKDLLGVRTIFIINFDSSKLKKPITNFYEKKKVLKNNREQYRQCILLSHLLKCINN